MSQSQKFPPTIVNANTLQGRERALKACAGGVAKTSGKQDPPSHLSYNYYTSTSAVWNIMHECSNQKQSLLTSLPLRSHSSVWESSGHINLYGYIRML